MKRLTLSKSWVLCLRMWKWIVAQIKKGEMNVEALKEEWLDTHGFGKETIDEDCFFCEYALQHGGCKYECPAKIVSPRFSCCRIAYHYRHKPIAFYNKLVSLNRKRLKKKEKPK